MQLSGWVNHQANEAFKDTCSHCGAPREVDPEFSDLYAKGYRRVYLPCNCREAAARRGDEGAAVEGLKAKWQRERTEAVLSACGIPTRFPRVPCEDEYAAVRLGMWLYIHGHVGTGKTTLAASIAQRWVEDNGATVTFAMSTDMLDDERARVFGRASAEAVASEYCTQGLLVIDDIGKETPTEWVLSRLFSIINARYENRLPTVFTSQFALNRLGERLAVAKDPQTALAIVSRIRGEASIERLDREDRRITRRKSVPGMEQS